MTTLALLPIFPAASDDLGWAQRRLVRIEARPADVPFGNTLESDAVRPCLEVNDLWVVRDDEALQSVLFGEEVHERLDLPQGQEVVRLVQEERRFPSFQPVNHG